MFGPWGLFVDIGIISALLLVGKWMRVKIKWIQKLFIPPSLLAGFMALEQAESKNCFGSRGK